MNSKIIIAVLALALVILSARLAFSGTKSSDKGSGDDAVYSNIMSRSSIRSYQNKDVEKDKVEKLLHAGMAAPSAMNTQPWHFIVVNDKNILAQIADITPNASMAKNAPLAIVVCGNLNKEKDGWEEDFWVQDVSAASENILLTAHAMGLGAVWTGTYPSKERCAAIAKLLKLPDYIIPLNTIVIGYPNEQAQPKDKWREDNISYNTFGRKDGSVSKVPATSEKKEFKKYNVMKDFHSNPFTWFKGNGLLLATGDRNRFNEMTIGWGALGNLWAHDNATITVYVAKGRYTQGFMEKSAYFTVMTFDESHKDILHYMGTHSGRDGDKVKALGLHTKYTKNGTPYFEEASEVYECKMIYHAPFDPKGFGDLPKKFYSDFPAGIHSQYIGELIGAWKK